MDVLVYGSGRVQSLARMCSRALDRLGHDTSLFERSYPNRTIRRAVRKLPVGKRVLAPLKRRAFLSRVSTFAPDLILVIKGYTLDARLVEAAVARSDAVAVNWNPDNPFQVRSERTRAETYLAALTDYDIAYIWDDFLVDDLRAEGATDVRVLPFAHDPTIHYPAGTTSRFECEVAFVGHWSEKRERVLGSLTEFDLQIRGPGWYENCSDQRLEGHIEGGALRGEAYTRAMSSADIVVNVLGDHNVPGHNMRTFEAPASGSLTMTTRTAGQQRFFEEDEEVVMYDDADELRERVAHYLAHPSKRESIAEAGLAAVRPHTYERRMERLLAEAAEYR